MMNLETPHRPGPLGALIDLTQAALEDFIAELEGLDAAALDAPRQPDGELRTLRQVADHVRVAAHIYLDLQRRAFGLGEEPCPETPGDGPSLLRELEAIPQRAWALLEDKAGWSDEELCAVRMEASWGQVFDLEQLLEHALAHVLRHRRQVRAWLDRDASVRRSRGNDGRALA